MSATATMILIDRGNRNFVGQQFFKDDIASFTLRYPFEVFLTYNFWKTHNKQHEKIKICTATNAKF